MKIEFIRRGAATRLILIFAGWSTNARFYKDCIIDGWDTAVVYDYRDMSMPKIAEQYSTIYVFAYSLGVWAASYSGIKATVKIAIFGTSLPVSDKYGIPKSIFMGTSAGLTEKSLSKFHLRMAGDREAFEMLKAKLPLNPDIDALREELNAIARNSEDLSIGNFHWNRAYIADSDRIIPPNNQSSYWENMDGTEIVRLKSSHAADIGYIMRQCIPNPSSIGESFANALSTYRQYAIVQSEICTHIGEMINESLTYSNIRACNLLEIGPGKGLLTEEWSKYITPRKATYIDLYQMQLFGKAPEERYLVMDAEEWLESSEEKFDVILSASTIQWFADPIRCLRDIKKHLNPGGIAIISTFTKGNLKELDTLRPSPIIYHDTEEYVGVGENIETEQWTRTLEFDSPRELLMHLKRTGVKPTGKDNRLMNKQSVKLTSLPDRLTYSPLILKIRNL